MTKKAETERRRRQRLILELLEDVIEGDGPLDTAFDLVGAVFPILARTYPSEASLKEIQAVYPQATAALKAERALSAAGGQDGARLRLSHVKNRAGLPP